MTDLKFNILKLLYNTYPLRELNMGEIFNSIAEEPIFVKNALNELKSRGFIKILTCSDVYKLTDSGAELYEQEVENRTKEAKHKRQYILSVILTVATLIATIFLSEPFIKFATWLATEKG